MSIENNIRKLRELKNYTQAYMADELNLSLSGYGKLERGEIDLTISRLEKIASILATDLNTIINFNSDDLLHPYPNIPMQKGQLANHSLDAYLDSLNHQINRIQAEIVKIRSSML